MKKIHFFLKMDKIPTITAQQKGERVLNGKIVHYDKKEVKEAKELFLRRLRPYIPEEQYYKGTPLALSITFYYPWNGRKKDAYTRYKVTRPDADNAAKILIDCMTKAGFWNDDSQIAIYHIEKKEVNLNYQPKFKYEETGIDISIEPLEQQEEVEDGSLEIEKKRQSEKEYNKKLEEEYQNKKEYWDAFEGTMKYFLKPLIQTLNIDTGYQE